MSRENNRTHWDQTAAQRFHLISSPFRPSKGDTKIMEDAVAQWSAGDSRGSLRVLLCGVTPEIACMAWPEGTELLAVDQSEEMIRLVWPGDIEGRRRAEHGDWLRLPQANSWFDLVVGDGCLSCMEYSHGYRILAASLHRVLKKQGLFLMRCFVRPEVSETPQDVFEDLLARRIGSFSAFRWRLMTALQEDPREGVGMGEVWQAWVDAGIDWNTVVARTGWPTEAIHSMPKGGTRFSFPTLGELRTTVSDHFEEVAVHIAQYELAERCPTLVLFPR